MIFNYIIWNVDPEMLNLGFLQIRWYGLLFAASFLLGYLLVGKMFKKEGYGIELLDNLTIYMVVGTVLGARLGHCLFYEPSYYLNNPLEMLKIWQGGLASHGAAIGILLALFFFARKYKKSYRWILDRIVIVVALAGFFIRSGNLMNSEIYGNSTGSQNGFVYVQDYPWHQKQNYIDDLIIEKTKDTAMIQDIYQPAQLTIRFAPKIQNKTNVEKLMHYQIKQLLARKQVYGEEANIYYPKDKRWPDNIKMNNGQYEAVVPVWVVPKHPTQLYEAGAYLLIFILLLFLYFYYKGRVRKGMLFGLFLFFVFFARFVIEFIKEDQVDFEQTMSLNMGQWLSIPFIVAGIVFFLISLRKPPTGPNIKP